MPLLTVSDYSKTFYIYHLERTIPVFHHLDFVLQSGEFLLVSGPNGAGKSTLLRCLYRTYRPTAGNAQYASLHGMIDLAAAADLDIMLLRQEEIGFVTQFLRPRPRVSALQLVAEPLLMTDTPFDDAQAQAEAMLRAFGLKEALWHAYPTTFSGGEQQKVNLARALVRPFRLLLLDEPTASLDADTRYSLAARLHQLKAQGVAMIGVLHHPEDLANLITHTVELTIPEAAHVVE